MAPAIIMIAVTRSGNNNLCHIRHLVQLHIVTSARGERPVPHDSFGAKTLLARLTVCATHAKARACRREGARQSAPSPTTMQNPFRFLADYARSHFSRLLLFHHALQRMLMLARKIHHLRHLGLGDFVGEHAALPDSMVMDMKHDFGRGFDVLLEELL
jgi:hypothetical protein